MENEVWHKTRIVIGRCHKITKGDYYLRHVCLSVRMGQLRIYWTILVKFDVWESFETVVKHSVYYTV